MLKGTQLFSPLTHLNEDVDNDERKKERASVMVVMYSDEKKKKKVCRTFEKGYQLKTAEETV